MYFTKNCKVWRNFNCKFSKQCIFFFFFNITITFSKRHIFNVTIFFSEKMFSVISKSFKENIFTIYTIIVCKKNEKIKKIKMKTFLFLMINKLRSNSILIHTAHIRSPASKNINTTVTSKRHLDNHFSSVSRGMYFLLNIIYLMTISIKSLFLNS